MTTLGFDYAKVDDNDPPDFAAARAAGARFAILRKSVTYHDAAHQAWRLAPDDHYARDAQHARDAGLVVGAYLFPAFGIGAPSPVDQVACFDHAAGTIVRGKDLPPTMDIEFPGRGIVDTGRTQAECLVLVRQFIAELTRLYSCAPMVYTSHVEMHDTNGLGLPNTGSWPDLTACPLWIKTPYRVAAGQPVDQVAPRPPHAGPGGALDPGDLWRIPAPWASVGWWLQQWQGDARGFPGVGQCDLDNFLPYVGIVSDPRTNWVADRLAHHVALDLRSFQKSRGLIADGIIGPRTFAALAW